MHARWRIELLDGPRAVGPDRVVTRFRTRKTGALLAYLALYRNRSHTRERLVEQFWPESEPEAGRTALRVALASLRAALADAAGAPVLIVDRRSARVDPTLVSTDVAEFAEALRAATRAVTAEERSVLLARALERFDGEFLPEYTDEWVLRERARLTETRIGALEGLVALREQAGALEEAVALARRAVDLDPLREESHRLLLRLLRAAGRPVAALRQYRELERILDQELQLAPAPETRALLPRRMARAGHAVRATPRAAPLGNLPRPLTRFFGREKEIGELARLLTETDAPRRLVTLSGPGGSGKTRLAIETAARLADLTAAGPVFEGIWFVPLADVGAPEQLPDAVRKALGLPHLPGGEPLEQIAAALEGRAFAPETGHALLLLDNFEHLVGGGASIVCALLERIPGLACLITSRRRLGVAGEQEVPVPLLPVPPQVGGTADTLLDYPSVQLFIDRARAARPDFRLTPENTAAVAALCKRLEGIPLAIELAAARVAVLTPAQMLARLDQRFDLLAAPAHGAPARHRSLRAALDWSSRLLSPELQRLFARLSVFRGGWTLAAAEAVCSPGEAAGPAADRSACAAPSTLDGLEQLCHSSLIVTEEVPAHPQTPEVRFQMLETLREFASERLTSPERAAVAERHARYYLARSEDANIGKDHAERSVKLDRLQREYRNLEHALAWGLQAPDGGEFALRLAGSLWEFWCFRGSLKDGREWLARALVRAGKRNSPSLRAEALMAAGSLAWSEADPAAALPLLEESIGLWQSLENRDKEAHALTSLAWACRNAGELQRAREAASSAIALYRGVGNRTRTVGALNCLGMLLAESGDHETARALVAESLVLARASGDPYLLSVALACTGAVIGCQGDDTAAWAYHEESIALSRTLSPLNALTQYRYLGEIAERQGRDAVARSMYAEGLAIAEELGYAHARDGFRERIERLDRAAGERRPKAYPASGKRRDLTDDEWARIQPLLSPTRGHGRPRAEPRRTLDGIRYVLGTACRWRDLPAHYGSPATCWRRWKEWQSDGTWERIQLLLDPGDSAN
jgi:predicted ATPase/DNA-binding SARP family transcriptional activator